MPDVRARLSAPDLPERLALLGFREDDARATLAAADAVLASPGDLAAVETLAPRLLAHLGDVAMERPGNPWDCPEARADHLPEGVLPLLTMLATVDDVRAFHARRGISAAVSWRSLADLGQQVLVHRLSVSSFGLHTHTWLVNTWSGGLYWLGRLQYTVRRGEGGFVLSCHIPRTGPLDPAGVDASFDRAAGFFAEHFPDHPAVALHCSSWLLDPRLADVLPPGSNLASFQRRWALSGAADACDDDVVFFVFARRGEVDIASLPRTTSLQRAVADHLATGAHWYRRDGLVPLPAVRGAASRSHAVSPVDARDPEALVRRFHSAYGLPVAGDAPSVARERVHMRLALIAEELAELVEAVYGRAAGAELEAAFTRAVAVDDGARDTVGAADALGDLVYVLYGMALECGIPLDEVLATIQESNLSKLGADGRPVLREDGKVLKGPGYVPPDVAGVLARLSDAAGTPSG